MAGCWSRATGWSAIREQADASADERKITLCNAGVMAFDGRTALAIIEKIGNANSKGEYYLTDAVAIVRELGLEAVVIETSEDEVRGINTKAQLAEAEARDAGATAQGGARRRRDDDRARDGLSRRRHHVRQGRDHRAVRGDRSRRVDRRRRGDPFVLPYRAGHRSARSASVGPYARLRPGTSLGEGARIGNFVETKAATLEAGVKVNHLTYIGDAHVGANANIGAGTITCNYDGFSKHKTEIGAGAFIGTNSSLVAPVKIGNGAYIGSGSVITRDVPDDAMALERSQQTKREGGAKRYREMKTRGKKPKKLINECDRVKASA